METVSKFMLTAESDRIAVEVRVNDIPLFESQGAAGSTNLPINDFLISGINRIEIKMRAPVDGTLPAEPPECAPVRVTLHENGVMVYIFVNPPPLDPPDPLPSVQESEFEFDILPGLRAWEKGEKLDAAAEPSESLVAFVKGIEQAFASCDVEALCEIFAVSAGDRAWVHGLDPDVHAAELRELFESFAKDPFWGMDAVDGSQLRLTVCGGGRLGLVKTATGEDPLHSKADGGAPVNFPIAVSRLDGKWVVTV